MSTAALLMAAGRRARAGDPFFANVKSLLHFNGADASTTFTDQKGITWTVNGNAQIDTAQSLYGGASGLFDGNNDYLNATDASFAPGTGDFCFEGAARKAGETAAGGNADGTLLDFRTAEPSAQIAVLWGGNTTVAGSEIYLYINGVKRANTSDLSNNTWYRWCVERVSGTTKLYVDGTSVGSYTDSNNYTATTAFICGRFAAVSGDRRSFNGHVDEMRFTVGASRYGGNYTPAVSAFPDS